MTYPGGKNGAGIYQRIINHMPPHRVYIEPFLGSGAVMRHKRPAERNIGIDRCPEALSLCLDKAGKMASDITLLEGDALAVERRGRQPGLFAIDGQRAVEVRRQLGDILTDQGEGRAVSTLPPPGRLSPRMPL